MSNTTTASPWIRCTERLPPAGQRVQTCRDVTDPNDSDVLIWDGAWFSVRGDRLCDRDDADLAPLFWRLAGGNRG